MQVSTQVQLVSTCEYLPIRFGWGLMYRSFIPVSGDQKLATILKKLVPKKVFRGHFNLALK